MSVSADYLAYVIDQLASFAKVTSRRMFGGVGLYADELFFGLIDDDTVFFKVDDSNRADYESRGCEPFRPFGDAPSMNYYRVPADVLEDPDELALWARKSQRIAAASAAAKAARKAPQKKKQRASAKRKARR